MTCRDCTAAAASNPRTQIYTVGCDSCQGRALAAMRFTADEIAGKHRQEIIDSFALWQREFRIRQNRHRVDNA